MVVDKCYFGNPVVFGMWSDAMGDNSNITYQECATKIVREQCDGGAFGVRECGRVRALWLK